MKLYGEHFTDQDIRNIKGRYENGLIELLSANISPNNNKYIDPCDYQRDIAVYIPTVYVDTLKLLIKKDLICKSSIECQEIIKMISKEELKTKKKKKLKRIIRKRYGKEKVDGIMRELKNFNDLR